MQPKRRPRKRNADGNKSDVPAPNEYFEPFGGSSPREGLPELPELANEAPTTEIEIHATFTIQHLLSELRYHWEMNNLKRGDKMMLAQLGKEVIEELEREGVTE